MRTFGHGHDDVVSHDREALVARTATLQRVGQAPASTGDGVRAGYVRRQQQLAHVALVRGDLGAARLSLRALRSRDFDATLGVTETYLDVLRDAAAGDGQVIETAMAIIRLPVRGPR